MESKLNFETVFALVETMKKQAPTYTIALSKRQWRLLPLDIREGLRRSYGESMLFDDENHELDGSLYILPRPEPEDWTCKVNLE